MDKIRKQPAMKKKVIDQAGCFENTQASLIQNGNKKMGTVPFLQRDSPHFFVPILHTMLAQPSNGFLNTQPDPYDL